MPKAFAEHEKELIGKRLLEHGARMFSTYGLRKTSVEEIADAAGISKGAFYGFYESKEALFMSVVEQIEMQVRRQMLEAIARPGPSPRARLLAVLKQGFALFNNSPILQAFTGNDFDMVFRRLPADRLQEHLGSDRRFVEELVTHCRAAGIPIKAAPEQVIAVAYPLVIAVLHKDDLGQRGFGNGIDLLLELVAAFCLGEVEMLPQATTAEPASTNGGSL